MSAERTSCEYCWHYDCAGHTPAVMAAATAMRGDGTQLDWPTCTGLAELVSAAKLLVDQPGESRKGDAAGRVWRCDNGNLYRWSDSRVWEAMPLESGQWMPSTYDGPDDMAGTGLTLTEVPPAQSGEATA